MAEIPTESPLVVAGISSVGSCFTDRPYCAASPQASHRAYPSLGLLDARNTYLTQEKGNRLPRPARPERRGLRSQLVKTTAMKLTQVATGRMRPTDHCKKRILTTFLTLMNLQESLD